MLQETSTSTFGFPQVSPVEAFLAREAPAQFCTTCESEMVFRRSLYGGTIEELQCIHGCGRDGTLNEGRCFIDSRTRQRVQLGQETPGAGRNLRKRV